MAQTRNENQMKIQEMKFIDNGEGVQPQTLTVEITLEEAIWIGKNAGRQQGKSPHSEIYNSLTGDFFNRFWDDGIKDAESETPVEIQPSLKWDELPISKTMVDELIEAIDSEKHQALDVCLRHLGD